MLVHTRTLRLGIPFELYSIGRGAPISGSRTLASPKRTATSSGRCSTTNRNRAVENIQAKRSVRTGATDLSGSGARRGRVGPTSLSRIRAGRGKIRGTTDLGGLKSGECAQAGLELRGALCRAIGNDDKLEQMSRVGRLFNPKPKPAVQKGLWPY
jgi:hypothetical protein